MKEVISEKRKGTRGRKGRLREGKEGSISSKYIIGGMYKMVLVNPLLCIINVSEQNTLFNTMEISFLTLANPDENLGPFGSLSSTIAVGKHKILIEGGKKGARNKVVDPFSKQDWYDVRALDTFSNRKIGKTLVTSTQGSKIESDDLKGHVFEPQNDKVAFRKYKLITEEVLT